MLDELVVRNFALIEEARICPGRGLVVVSGETGTGKTLLLGALRLLLGADARSELVGPFGDEAVVEGRFIINGDEVVVSRRIPREGRSRAYLDGSLASGPILAERLGGIVEIIGQHDQLSLTRANELRALVDGLLDNKGRKSKDAYRVAWEWLVDLENARSALGGDLRALTRELDLTRFQATEIEGAGFQPGDDEILERKGARLRNAEALMSHLGAAAASGEEAANGVGTMIDELRRASRLDPGMQDLATAAEGLADSMTELARSVRRTSEEISNDSDELAEVESQLTRLGELRRKYGSSLDDVIAFGEETKRRSQELTDLIERADTIDTDHRLAVVEVAEKGHMLAEARRRAGLKLTTVASTHLRQLGMDDPGLEIEVGEEAPGAPGADRLRLLFSSDRRLPLADASRVASGGELSRLILSLRLASLQHAESGRYTVLAFDEIDAGVGGATALQMGRKLGALATEYQVLCVTHLPQVAAFADTHFVVERTGNTTTIGEIGGERRIEELSRMLAGLPDSARGQEAAAELVAIARGAGIDGQ